MSEIKKPIHHKNCWECPECHTSNAPPNTVLMSMPPQTPYYCMACDYRWHYIPDYNAEYPIGEKIQSSARSTNSLE